jgi:hypothetical protein
MLTNATITRIDRAAPGGAADAIGRPRIVAGNAVSIRCALDMIGSRQRYILGAVLEDATQVVYIERGALVAAGQASPLPAPGYRLVLLADGAAETHTVAIVTTGDRVAPGAGGLSHLELFVRRVLS